MAHKRVIAPLPCGTTEQNKNPSPLFSTIASAPVSTKGTGALFFMKRKALVKRGLSEIGVHLADVRCKIFFLLLPPKLRNHHPEPSRQQGEDGTKRDSQQNDAD